MRPLTSIDDYRSPEVFARERSSLFRDTWQFAGFTRELASDNDYTVAEVAGKSLVIQNFGGDLRCFENVCSHRYSEIRSACKGNGPLQCPYHGWVYDKAGVPAGIAHIREFDCMTPERRSELALRSWQVDTCGELVFIKANPEGPSLRSWLEGAWDRVYAIGTSLGEQIDCNRMEIASNWKVIVENTLEAYHAPFVHPESISQLIGNAREVIIDFPHTTWVAEVQPKTRSRLEKLVRHLGIHSIFDAYHHQLVFPSLTLATTVGMTYSIQQIRPLDASRTEFTSFVFAAKVSDEAGNRMLAEATSSVGTYNRRVFEEDRVICEGVQRGIERADVNLSGELSHEEHRVYQFQLGWQKSLAGEPLTNNATA